MSALIAAGYMCQNWLKFWFLFLNPLHSEWPKLHRVLAVLSAIGLIDKQAQIHAGKLNCKQTGVMVV